MMDEEATSAQLRQAALDLEEKYRATVELSPAMHWVADAKGRLIDVPERLTTLTGLDRDQLLGDGWQQLIHPDDLAGVIEAREAALRADQGDGIEFRARLKAGAYRWMRTRAQPRYDAEGRVVRWYGAAEDITDRREADTALREMTATFEERIAARTAELEAVMRERKAVQAGRAELEQRFAIFIEEVSDYAIMMLEPDGLIANWNTGAERIKGYTAREVIGKHFRTFYPPEAQAAGLPEWALKTAIERGRFVHEGWRVRKDGSCFWASVVLQPIHDENNQLLGFTKITRDITERREAQRALDEAREQLFQAQKLEAVGQLTGGIAHDFNNLLQAIGGALYLIRRRHLQGRTEEVVQLVDHALSATDRAASLTHRLLAFARRQPLDPRAVDANALIRNALQLIQGTIDAEIELKLDLDPALWTTFCDPHQLEAALINLAVNARDAMRGGGSLTISTRNSAAKADSDDEQIAIAVTDTGIGMEQETVERAFEPFFTTKPIGHGTGLGLSMIHGFAHQSLGRVTLESTPGKGTTATIWLPRHLGPAEPLEPVDRDEDVDRAAERKVVLVVEDEPLVRELVTTMLDEMGHNVVAADDGLQGLKVLRSSRRIDLLLSDIGLPGLTGRKMVEAMRPLRPDLPVILMTGFAHEVEQADKPLGAHVSLLPKPFTMSALTDRVRSVLEDQEG
ncbi:PAS domain S-box-containing protein [Arboricoccus pini]|uniref:histidine kinase n=1 Tax=Arboricoccus pini TaxID=1963835 RepID=A0A212RI88_9PROT|nr:PAS domain-containing hybrid sensor histidine kinase/response regulator [Arboricoccus pini]SNB72086.1 PAS domain S-box-containing protein [Arboricoccus pini]